MAVAQLVFSNITPDAAVMSCDFESQELDSGAVYTFTAASKKYLIITALADIYVAFSSGAAAPNAAVTPRVKITAGQSFPFSIRSGVKVTVVSA